MCETSEYRIIYVKNLKQYINKLITSFFVAGLILQILFIKLIGQWNTFPVCMYTVFKILFIIGCAFMIFRHKLQMAYKSRKIIISFLLCIWGITLFLSLLYLLGVNSSLDLSFMFKYLIWKFFSVYILYTLYKKYKELDQAWQIYKTKKNLYNHDNT